MSAGPFAPSSTRRHGDTASGTTTSAKSEAGTAGPHAPIAEAPVPRATESSQGAGGGGRAVERGGRGAPRGHEPHRTDAHVVGAPHAVAVVVGVVGADLQREGDGQRARGAPSHEAVVARSQARPDENGHDRSRQ